MAGGMLTISGSGKWDNTRRFLTRASSGEIFASLSRYAEEGRKGLEENTPKDSSLAAGSWEARVVQNRSGVAIIWSNTDVESGFHVAIQLQYGYATGTGGWVQGRDYINPVLVPLFDRIADSVWKEVTR